MIEGRRGRPQFRPDTRRIDRPVNKEALMGKGILLWLLGVPIPIIILLLLLWH